MIDILIKCDLCGCMDTFKGIEIITDMTDERVCSIIPTIKNNEKPYMAYDLTTFETEFLHVCPKCHEKISDLISYARMSKLAQCVNSEEKSEEFEA